jgi:hypothetical protein
MKQKVLKKKGGTRPKFTLACGVLTAIAFVSMVQAFFVLFKSHHTVDQLSSIFTHKHYPHGQREHSDGDSSPASLPFITTHNNIYNDSAIDTRFVNGSSSSMLFHQCWQRAQEQVFPNRLWYYAGSRLLDEFDRWQAWRLEKGE